MKSYDGFEFSCDNGKTYKCVAHKGKSVLYDIVNEKNEVVDTLIESYLREILDGKRPLIYYTRNQIKTMILKED